RSQRNARAVLMGVSPGQGVPQYDRRAGGCLPLSHGASTRKSPSRRVTAARSRYSHRGTAYLPGVPSRSATPAPAIPRPPRPPVAPLPLPPPPHPRLGVGVQVQPLRDLHQQALRHAPPEQVAQAGRVAARLPREVPRLRRLEPRLAVGGHDLLLELPQVG